MKVLLDSCVWGSARVAVQAAGHEVAWVRDWPSDPGDAEILRVAHEEGRVLATLDKDFGELAVVKGAPHAGIVRLVGLRAREQGPVLAEILATYEQELREGAILTVSPDRVRVRTGSR